MTTPVTPQWGADCPISMPQVITTDPGGNTAEMGGFLFTTQGLVHDLTSTDREELIGNSYGPTGEIRAQ